MSRSRIDYEDAYLSLREKHLALAKQMREKEDAWKLQIVKLRKASEHHHDESTASAAPPAAPSPNGGRAAPSSVSTARPASASASSSASPRPKTASSTPRPGSALSARPANRVAGGKTPASAIKRPGSATPPPAGAGRKGPSPAGTPSKRTATPDRGNNNNNSNVRLPPAAVSDSIAYDNVQLGALSAQLNSNYEGSELSAARGGPSRFASPSVIVRPGESQQHYSGGGGGGVPPVHFEVVSLSPESNNNRTNSNNLTSILEHPGMRRPPETSMFWGIDGDLPLDATVTGRTLAEVNDRLRQQLRDCEATLRRFSQEAAINRQVMDKQESQIQQLEHQILLIVQERDSMAQRTNATTSSVQNLQQQLEGQLQQHEAVRGSLEVQCRELRNKLMTEIDQKEFLERELGKSKNDTQEQLLTVASLQSRVAVAEASLANQRSTNETLLVEMKGLNDQLATERRKTLATTRDMHLASHSRQRTEELELQMQSTKEQMQATQSENLRLLEQVARCQEQALKTATGAVEAELSEAKAQASHWEHVSLLQFRELEQNSKQRAQLRLDFESVKADRDEATLLLNKVKSELVYANAKLDLCWPSHARDTTGLNVEQIRAAFARRMAARRGGGGMGGMDASSLGGGGASPSSLLFSSSQHASGTGAAAIAAASGVGGGGAGAFNDSIGGPIHDEDLVAELQAANSVLMAENESLRLQNSLLIERLEEAGIHFREKTKQLETQVQRVAKHEQANLAHASRQANRIEFLEALVREMRGSVVESSTFSVAELSGNETVLEVFLGKMLLENAPIAPSSSAEARAVPSVVAVVDFLIHESTVSAPVLPTLHASFDQTFAYRVNADAVLLHNVANGTVSVEIHEVHNGTQHHLIAKGEVGFRELLNVAEAKRPSLRTHVNMFRVGGGNTTNENNSNNNDQQMELYGRLEIVITSRVPFPPDFVRLCEEFRESSSNSNNSGNNMSNNNNNVSNTAFNPNGTVHHAGGGGRTLFMPDPRDTSLSFSGVGGYTSSDKMQQRGTLGGGGGGELVSSSAAASGGGENTIALLLRCNQIKMRFLRVAVDFSEKESPLLSWWYSFGANIGDSWVLPTENQNGRYDAPIEVTNVHEFASPEELVAALRKTFPVVAFDEAEEDPSKHWGIASMTLSSLMVAPSQVLSLQLPVLSPSGHTRATLFAEASIATVEK